MNKKRRKIYKKTSQVVWADSSFLMETIKIGQSTHVYSTAINQHTLENKQKISQNETNKNDGRNMIEKRYESTTVKKSQFTHNNKQ